MNTLFLTVAHNTVVALCLALVVWGATRVWRNPAIAHLLWLLVLLKLVAPPAVSADHEERLRAGGLGYGDLKKALFEHYWNYFAAARARRAELAANPDYVEKVLRDSANQADAVGRKVLDRARAACGLD